MKVRKATTDGILVLIETTTTTRLCMYGMYEKFVDLWRTSNIPRSNESLFGSVRIAKGEIIESSTVVTQHTQHIVDSFTNSYTILELSGK